MHVKIHALAREDQVAVFACYEERGHAAGVSLMVGRLGCRAGGQFHVYRVSEG